MVRQMTESERWAVAWFTMAEGCIRLQRARESYFQPYYQVTNTDKSLLETLKSIIGAGTVFIQGKKRDRCRQAYSYQLYGYSNLLCLYNQILSVPTFQYNVHVHDTVLFYSV